MPSLHQDTCGKFQDSVTSISYYESYPDNVQYTVYNMQIDQLNGVGLSLYRNLSSAISSDEQVIADIRSSVYAEPIKHIYPKDFSEAENNQRLHESFHAFSGQVVNHLKFRDEYFGVDLAQAYGPQYGLHTLIFIRWKSLYVYNFNLFNMTSCPNFKTVANYK